MIQKGKNIFRTIIFLLIIGITSSAYAQETESNLYQVQTTDGNIYRGYLIEKNFNTIQLQTKSIGIITIQFEDVVKIEKLNGDEPAVQPPQTYYQDPSDFREASKKSPNGAPQTYFVSPSSFGLKKGEAYYQNIYVFLNQVNVGITDRFSLGLGGVLIPAVDTGIPIWVMPKIKIPLIEDKLIWGVGSLHGALLETDPYGFGAVFTDFSFGSKHNHVSVGFGGAYEYGVWSDQPFFSFNGMLRVSPSISITSENYVSEFNSFLSLHAYQYLSSEVVLQWGLMLVGDNYDLIPLPLLGLQVPIRMKLK